MFDLLTPIFAVAGAATAAVPILLHMLRRTPSQTMPFSLVRFLRPSLPKMTRRSKIEHWPLMLLRMLALVLIGLAFARPFQRMAISGPVIEGAVNRVAVLVDSSASMRRDGIREQVVRQIRDVTEDLKDVDVLSVTFFSRTSRTLLTSEEWSRTEPGIRQQLLERVIRDYEPDWMDTRTGAALLSAAEDVSMETAGAARVGERRIVLISDFQRGSQLDELRSAVWPAAVEVDLRIVRSTESGNAGISSAPENSQGQVRVQVTNSADSLRSDFRVQPFDVFGNAAAAPISIDVAPGQRKLVVVPVGSDDPSAVISGITLLDDSHPFDNVVDLPLLEHPLVQIAHVGPSDVNDPDLMRYYLQRVVDGNDAEPVEVIDLQQPDGGTLPVDETVRLVVATAVLPESLLPSVRRCLERGGLLLVALTDVRMLRSISDLLPVPLSAEEAAVNDYAMLGKVDFRHPLFSSFAEARFADFSSIRFWQYRQLKPELSGQLKGNQKEDNQPDSDWHVAAAFDNGDPCVMECRTAEGGRILIFAAGWHPDDSQWALSSRFAPMLTSVIRQSNPVRTGQIVFTTGQTIVPTDLIGSDNWTLTLPSAERVASVADRERSSPPVSTTERQLSSNDAEGAASVLLEWPGRYVLSGTTPTGDRTMDLIVGLPAAETRTDPLPVGQLQALGIPAVIQRTHSSPADTDDPVLAGQLNSAELESRQKLWRWMLLAGLGCLLLESVIAGGIERRRHVESAA